MSSKLTRRTFFSASVAATAASTALIGTTGLAKFLARPDAATQVFTILRHRLGLTESQRPVAEAFTRSLQTSNRHHEPAAAFEAKLAGAVGRGELLEIYVLQEFVITTNYIAFAKGAARTLELRHGPLQHAKPIGMV